MRLSTRNLIQTAVIALAILLPCSALQANTVLMLPAGGADYTYHYTDGSGHDQTNTENAGPYPATLNGGSTILVFCLDDNLTTNIGQSYNGTLNTLGQLAASTPPPSDLLKEEQASFLAAYALERRDASLYGSIQMAIWQIMGTLGSNPQDNSVQTQNFVSMVSSLTQASFTGTLLMDTARIWRPDATNSSQRFVTVTPEPDTMIFMGTGVLLLAFSRIRRRRP